MTLRPSLTAVLVAAGTAIALAACGGTNTPASSPSSTSSAATSTAALKGTVNVFAAASLQESFTTLKKQFEAAHPGVTVTPNFGASSALAQQINQGAPADVFASASWRRSIAHPDGTLGPHLRSERRHTAADAATVSG